MSAPRAGARRPPRWFAALAAMMLASTAGAAGSTGALGSLSEQLAGRIARAPGPIAVWVDAPAAELRRGVQTLVVARLSERGAAAAPIEAPDPVQAERLAREAGARSLARISLSLEGGVLHARGDLLGTWVNFWSGDVATRPAQPAEVFAVEAPVDALALGMISSPLPTPGGRGTFRLERLAELPAPPAALAAADLDGDGRDELAVLTDDEVLLFSATGALLAKKAHAALGLSPTPCREPFGAISATGRPRELAFFSARRPRGEVLRWVPGALATVAELGAAPLAPGLSGAFVPGEALFAAEVHGDRRPALTPPAPFVSLSLAGELALAVLPGAKARLFTSSGPGAIALSELGASALVDLDGDGQSELATSSSAFAPTPDQLRLLELPPLGAGLVPLSAKALTPVVELPVPEGKVLLVAAAQLERGAPGAVLLGVWLPGGHGALYLARRIPR